MKSIDMKDLAQFQADYVNRNIEEADVNCANLFQLLQEGLEVFEKTESVEICFKKRTP